MGTADTDLDGTKETVGDTEGNADTEGAVDTEGIEENVGTVDGAEDMVADCLAEGVIGADRGIVSAGKAGDGARIV